MSDAIAADLFVEDRAHEEFLKPLLSRLAAQIGKAVTLRVRSARGGHGRVLQELALYQRSVTMAPQTCPMPDLLVVAIDANCKRFAKAMQEIQNALQPPFQARAVIACPDPHIERWYLADLDAFARVVGTRPKLSRRKCERGRYKVILSKAIMDAGHPPTLGGIEFAPEIVGAMDFFLAGKNEPSLRRFINDVLARLRSP